jgi:hypothetical protein
LCGAFTLDIPSEPPCNYSKRRLRENEKKRNALNAGLFCKMGGLAFIQSKVPRNCSRRSFPCKAGIFGDCGRAEHGAFHRKGFSMRLETAFLALLAAHIWAVLAALLVAAI